MMFVQVKCAAVGRRRATTAISSGTGSARLSDSHPSELINDY